MAEVKKYYWIKLKTDFFNIDKIDFILAQPNGCEYIVLYQMLCLMTANSGGELAMKINEVIMPFDVEKIVRDTKYFDIDTVLIALNLFKKLGLIFEQENEIMKITGHEEMINSETAWAEKKRRYREIGEQKEQPELNEEAIKKAVAIAKTPWVNEEGKKR